MKESHPQAPREPQTPGHDISPTGNVRQEGCPHGATVNRAGRERKNKNMGALSYSPCRAGTYRPAGWWQCNGGGG